MASWLLRVATCVLAVSTVSAAEFAVDPTRHQDTVYFRSAAKLEFIEGKTNSLIGGFTFDPQRPQQGAGGVLQCDLSTLKTGIDTRDGHMRDRHLHTDKYPHAFFQLTSVTGLPASMETGKTFEAEGKGWFYIHGGKREIAVMLSVTPQGNQANQSIQARARFTVKLDDFKIPRPKALFLKLAETIEVEVIFTAFNNLPVPQITLPDWPELE